MERARNCGFSLVEVVLAIGVMAFAFLALFSLMPTGMTAFRAAIDTSLESQIVQRIVGDAQQTDFDTLLAQGQYVRYFNDEGTSMGAQSTVDSIYTVQVTPAPALLPGADAASANLLTLTIRIVHDAAHAADPFGASSRLKDDSRTAYIARNGKS